MDKFLITACIAVFLFSQQVVLADSKYRYRHYQSHKHPIKYKGFPHRVRSELILLNTAIIEVKAEIDKLKSEPGGLPPDLVTRLTALESGVADNTVDISLALTDIVNILQELATAVARLDDHNTRLNGLEAGIAEVEANLDQLGITVNDLETRVLALEQAPPPADTDVVFTADFTVGATPDTAIQLAWDEFRSNSTGEFSAIEIRSSRGGSAVCSDPLVVSQIAAELNSHVPTLGSLASFACEGVFWNIGNCSVAGGTSVELNSGSNPAVCLCGQGAVVRPEIGSLNWGGVGSEFGGSGGTCGAPSQTLEVILTR